MLALAVPTRGGAFGGSVVVAAATDDPAGVFSTAMTDDVGGRTTDVQRVLIVTSRPAARLACHLTSPEVNRPLVSIGPMALLTGVGLAPRRRAHRPEVYARRGGSRVVAA
ncbi:hypothetical protein [Streptomyces sp. BE303]|uniref:hypothetical protein n=1 Tax=Streptomyces sp. BE303 TaxID=3002528 RepID=UPI002E777A46|nr:hypothetical protein [Streptomyces sp. BE303]MED7952600.1 hypothetical protein [Streptomyces sp. BE303]